MGACLRENTIQAFVEGCASAREAAHVEEHIDECDECRRKLAEVTRAIASVHTSGMRPASSNEALPAGARVGRYTVVSALGRGAMGIVYAAYDPDLDRKIALKLVRTGEGSTVSGGGSTRGRVLREAKAIARLSHPNVVAVHDVGTYGADEVFIAMELVEGGTLRDHLVEKGQALSWRETLALLLAAGEGLAAAHAAGLVHRDFKPDNVLIGKDGRPRVADFGLARATAAEDGAPSSSRGALAATEAMAETLTMTGTILGTPAYMAPEQMRGERADARSDLFAFCVVLHEALFRERPFSGKTLLELKRSLEAGAVRPYPAKSDVPRWVYDAIARGLAARPEDRWATMGDLLAALRAEPRPRWSRAAIALAAAGASVAALAAIALAFGVARGRAGGGGGEHFPTMRESTPVTPAIAGFEPTSFRRITFEDGCEEFPSFTPDGETIVFDGADGGDSALFALSVRDLTRRRITKVHGWDFAASVSPDGKSVAFLRSAPDQSGAFVVPFDATPDVPPRFVTKGSLRPSWSPDGKALWAGEHAHFTKVSVENGQPLRTLDIPAGFIGGQSIELADGRLAVTFPFIAEAAAGAVGVYAADGTLTRLLEGNVGEVLAKMPGSGDRIVAVRKMENAVPNLVALPLDGSAPVSLGSSGVLPRKGLAFSPDGKEVVYSTCRGQRSILAVPAEGRATPVSEGAEWEDTDVAAVPGGRSIVVVSERTGRAQLWVVDRDHAGASPRVLALPPDTDPVDVALSPDGRWAATTVTPKGIVLVDLRGEAPPRALTSDPTDLAPAFDATGEHVLFSRESAAKKPVVMRVAVSGGDAEAYLEPGSRDPSVARDGRVLYLRGDADKALVPTIYDPKTRARAPLSRALAEGAYAHPQVSPDGTKAIVIRGGMEAVEIDLTTGAIVRRWEHDGDGITRVVYSGDDLVAAIGTWVGDLWMADLR